MKQSRKVLSNNSYLEQADFGENIMPTRLKYELANGYEATQHRNWDCVKYEDCLDKVDLLDWQSFSCRHCPRFSQLAA